MKAGGRKAAPKLRELAKAMKRGLKKASVKGYKGLKELMHKFELDFISCAGDLPSINWDIWS